MRTCKGKLYVCMHVYSLGTCRSLGREQAMARWASVLSSTKYNVVFELVSEIEFFGAFGLD